MNNELLNRITIDPRVMTGRPCIRGMRITAANVLRLLSNGHSHERILKAYPDLEDADIDACLAFAAMRVDEREIEFATTA